MPDRISQRAGLLQPPGLPGWRNSSRWGKFRGVITDTGQPPVTPTPVPPPKYGPGMPAKQALPHFQMPFTLDASGKPVCVEQGSPQDVASSVYNIAACPQGAKIADPKFGIPGPLFQTLPVNTAAIEQQIRALEPRAQLTVTAVDSSTTTSVPIAAINDSTMFASGQTAGAASVVIEVSSLGV